MMHYRTIDMMSYPRRAQFDYFHSLQNPMLGVTVDVDATALRAFAGRRAAPSAWPSWAVSPWRQNLDYCPASRHDDVNLSVAALKD